MKPLLTLLCLWAGAAVAQTAYWTTNSAGQAVLYVAGGTNAMKWQVRGFVVTATNTAGAGGAAEQLDPSTNASTRAYYQASSNYVGLVDGTTITNNWTDLSGVSLRDLIPASTPTKETVDGKTVVRLDGVADKFSSSVAQWSTNFGWAGYGVIVARIKPATNTQSMLFSWSDASGGGGTDTVVFWTPYDGVLYLDFRSAADGRVQASAPANWDGNWHTVVWKYDGNTFTLRVDGQTLSTTNASSVSVSGQGYFRLGAHPDGVANFWAGDVQGMAFFSTGSMTLTDADKYGEWLANH